MAFDDDYRSSGELARERVYGDVQRTTNRGGRLALASALLAVGGFLLILAISAYQVTEPGRSSRLIERGIASVTDIDQYLGETLPELREEAADRPDGVFRLPAYPLPVAVTGQEVTELSDRQFRQLVLQRSSAVVYANGLRAFEQEEAQSFPLISAENVVESFLGLLTGPFHNQAGIAAVVLALVVAVSGAMAAAADRRPGVLRVIGGALLAASIVGLVLSAGLVFLISRSAGTDPFTSEIAGIAESIALVPRRNFFIATIFSGLLFLGGVALTLLERRYFEPEEEPADAYYPAAGYQDDVYDGDGYEYDGYEGDYVESGDGWDGRDGDERRGVPIGDWPDHEGYSIGGRD